MADTILTLRETEDLFRTLTFTVLGIDLDDEETDNNDKVRLSWHTYGAPAWKITDDIVFLRVATVPDAYIQQRESDYQDADITEEAINVVSAYTRVWSVQWVLYGPNSFDNAEKIKNAMYVQTIKETLAAKNMYLILNVPNVTRIPELYNGQWWKRADFSATFNEQVTIRTKVPYITGTDISLVTEDKGVIKINGNSTS
ncbi:MAG TPA: hypothetical protein DCZ10_15705 [Pelotomaculum sp.]|mgnify:CR=1 FL=1|nr:hypothetical protein [Pelotomaculum sp.]